MALRKNRNINKGAALLSMMFLLLFFVLIARFAYIGTVKNVQGKDLDALAKQKWVAKMELQAERGTIFGSKGEPFAKNVPAYTVTAVLTDKYQSEHVENPKKTAAQLAPILNMEEDRLLQLLTKDSDFVELGPGGRRISYEKKEKIEALDLPGIDFITESKRFYPNGMFASYVLGFAARDQEADRLFGEIGIEKSMDDALQGHDGAAQYLSTTGGVRLPGTEEERKEPQDGHDVYLTIDSRIQMFLEQAMSKAYEEYHPERMMAVVADPKTGKILAMSNRPSFDPNTRDIDDYTNNIISDRFEPGSVMKIFTLAAAVDAGVYNGDEQLKSGTYQFPGGRISDWNNNGWGTITFDEGVERSSNVAFAKLAREKLGFDRFYDYLLAFDFKEKTGIGLPNEETSVINYDVPYDKVATSFGQATAITTIQLVKASTAIANDGKMMKPYIIEKVVNPNNGDVVLNNEPEVAGTPMSAEASRKVRDLLRTVVAGDHGTGQEFAIEGYDVAGKTGTAQITGNDGTYINGEYIHSFWGVAPADDPELAVYVAVDRPEVEYSYQGSEPVADVFTTTMKNSLQYLNIGPNQDDKHSDTNHSVTLDHYEGKAVKDVKKHLKNEGLKTTVLGSGTTVTAQAPYPETTVLSGERILLRTGGKVKMPDMSGWSLADVMKLADLLGLKPETEGSGYVVSQNIAPGHQVKSGETLTVKLSSTQNGGEEEQ